MTHLITYAENINALMHDTRCRKRFQQYARMSRSTVKPDRPKIVLDGETILTVKK